MDFGDAARSGWIDDRVAVLNDQLAAAGRDPSVAAESRGSECTILQEMILASEDGTQPRSVQLFEIGTQLALDTGAFTSFEAASGDPSPYGRTPGGPHRSVVVQTCTVPSFMPAAPGGGGIASETTRSRQNRPADVGWARTLPDYPERRWESLGCG